MIMMFWLIVPILFFPAIESDNYHLMELRKPSGEEAVRLRRALGSCLPNPCFHQGVCRVVDDRANCTCKTGFTGQFCKDMEVKLQCKEEYMKMLVRKEVFETLKVPLRSVHLMNGSCVVSEQDEDGESFFGAMLTGENHTACGSEIKVNGSHVSYANVIESDREDNGVITRSNVILIHFSCIYAYKPVVSLQYSLKAMDTFVQFSVKEGDFTVTMGLYESASFKKPYSQQPLSLLMSDTLYVLLQIEGQDQVKYFLLSVEDCWGTPTNDPDDSTKHHLIMKGCPRDKTLEFLNVIGTSTVAKFSFQMFHFKNLSEVFLHCQVRLCIKANQEPCVKQCPIKQRNKRQLEDDYMKVVSYGPIVFAAPSLLETRNANDQPSFWGSQMWVPGVMAVVALIAIFIFIAVVKAMKK
ncbi:uromodulin-like [Pantherophis guttatus]|uniref:Uromodulin-like n=1 Tax=Pantherophis guttatus TaxID=94885 RepID=A0A6P9CQD5_PANGU|nr:uromodulin-like [Pantherophis guttatus]